MASASVEAAALTPSAGGDSATPPASFLPDDLDDDLDETPASQTDAHSTPTNATPSWSITPEPATDPDVRFVPEAIDDEEASTPRPLASHVPAAAEVRVLRPSLTPDGRPIPPSQTRKRQRGRSLATVHLDLNARPTADGLWRCAACNAMYTTRTGLFAHTRFCEGINVWRCSWCRCLASQTNYKASGPNGSRTLCSACGARYRNGHNGLPSQNELGEFVCSRCARGFTTLPALGSHRRFCDGGTWRCSWCHCRAEDTPCKGTGPDGKQTLCNPCAARFRAGRSGPPSRNEEGKFVCEACGRAFDSVSGLGSHRSRCDNGVWRCSWCNCKSGETAGKGPGPDGARTLCATCSSRYRSGRLSAPPPKTEAGRFACESCERSFETFAALGVHKRHCDAGVWRCAWCHAKFEETSGKGPGPDGPGTLCSACSGRHRSGATRPPTKDKEGRYRCEQCDRSFETIAALGIHRRFCDGGAWQCNWCGAKKSATQGKGPGPDGPGTLCSTCSARFRAGRTEPPLRDASGAFLCECGRTFETLSNLGRHRRHCKLLASDSSRLDPAECSAQVGVSPGPASASPPATASPVANTSRPASATPPASASPPADDSEVAADMESFSDPA